MGKINLKNFFTKKNIKEYLLTGLGTAICAIGIYYFLAPENIATGGVTGFSIVLLKYFDLPISTVAFAINMILLLMGFIFVGSEFGGKTIFSIFALWLTMKIVETISPNIGPATTEILLNMIVGVLMFAVGLAIAFNQNASTGGTDILAKIFNKFFHVPFGTGLLMADALVVILSLLAFGLETALVGVLGWYIKGVMTNYFIDGFQLKKEITIISDKCDEVKTMVNNVGHRGATIYKGEGSYTGKPKKVIVTVVTKNEYFKLKKRIAEIDPEAFLITRNVQEVEGQGFTVPLKREVKSN